jgi:two-component system, sensor histidine kinase RegB
LNIAATPDAAPAGHSACGSQPGKGRATDHGPLGPLLSPLQGLRLLAGLRFFTLLTTLLLLLHSARRGGAPGALNPLALLFGAQVLVAFATQLRLRHAPPVKAWELLAQAHLDIALLAAILFFTGNAASPFLLLLTMPLLIAVTAFEPLWLWVISASTIAACAYLATSGAGLFGATPDPAGRLLLDDGAVFDWALTAALLALVATRVSGALRRHASAVALAREAEIRRESAESLATLTAAYAHQLSAPLATMAVVVGESKRDCTSDPALQRDLQLLEDQIEACKRIISDLAAAGGGPRAESADACLLDRFLRAIVDRARAQHPNTAISATFDTATPPPMIVADAVLRLQIEDLINEAARRSPQRVGIVADWSGPELVVAIHDPAPTRGAAEGGLEIASTPSAPTLRGLLHGFDPECSTDNDGGPAEIRVPLRAIALHAN